MMEVDTGAAVSIISKEKWLSLFPNSSLGRRFVGGELKHEYWQTAVCNLEKDAIDDGGVGGGVGGGSGYRSTVAVDAHWPMAVYALEVAVPSSG